MLLVNKKNIEGSFKGACLVLFNPEAILSKLEVYLYTILLPPLDIALWEPETPSYTLEF